MKQAMTFEQVVERVEPAGTNRRDFYMPTREMQLDGSRQVQLQLLDSTNRYNKTVLRKNRRDI